MTRFRPFMAIAARVYFALAGLFARRLPDSPWVSLTLAVFGLHSIFVALVGKAPWSAAWGHGSVIPRSSGGTADNSNGHSLAPGMIPHDRRGPCRTSLRRR